MIRKATAAAVACSMALSACATEGSMNASGQPLSAVERAQQNCKAAIFAGALLGAVAGAAADRRNRGSGAAIGGGAGAAVGAGFCGVMLAMANETDRRHIAEAQRLALETGRAQREQYTGEDGKVRLVSVTTQDVPVPSPAVNRSQSVGASNQNPEPVKFCKQVNTGLGVAGAGTASPPSEVWCQGDNNEWKRMQA